MALSKEDIDRLAELSRLELTPQEAKNAQAELERVLGYVSRLSNIDTKGVAETEESDIPPALREDVSLPTDAAVRELILSDFPDRSGDALRVPAVFEKPKG